MSIYTKTGDKGKTSLFGGKRVAKYDLQVESYGSVDEATSFIGFALERVDQKADKELLTDIQKNLYIIMGYLCNGPFQEEVIQKHLKAMEEEIDLLEKKLPKLTHFILPQGSEATTRLHLARVMTRSAERRVVALFDAKKEQTSEDQLIVQYINRLSDLFFMLARRYSTKEIKA